jgi:hypothetical protein
MPSCDYTGPLRWAYDWQPIIAGIIAVAGALGGGWLAYLAGKKQADTTRDSTIEATTQMLTRGQLVERAYISGGGVRAREPSGISATGAVLFRETGEFEFHINNYGKTPGRLYKLGFAFCDEGAPPATPQYEFVYQREPIDPGRRGEFLRRERIRPEHQVPVVYGRFYYETVFGTRHSSGFFYRILPNSPPQSIKPPSDEFTRDRDGYRDEDEI